MPEDSLEGAIEDDNETSDLTIELPDAPKATNDELPDEVLTAAAKFLAEAPAEPQILKPTEELRKPVSSGPVNETRPRAVWQLPDFRALLSGGSTGEMDEGTLLLQAQVIEDTLASFGAPGRVVELNTGPVITAVWRRTRLPDIAYRQTKQSQGQRDRAAGQGFAAGAGRQVDPRRSAGARQGIRRH